MILTGSLTSHFDNLVCACAHVFRKRPWGALIEAGVLKRENTVYKYIVTLLISCGSCCIHVRLFG